FRVGAKSHGTSLCAPLNDLVQSLEGSATDEQHVGRINLDVLLLRMLPSTLRGHVCDCSFQDLQESLLHAFAGYVAGYGGVLGLPGDLVDLVDVNDAALGVSYGVLYAPAGIRRLKQLQKNVLYDLAH